MYSPIEIFQNANCSALRALRRATCLFHTNCQPRSFFSKGLPVSRDASESCGPALYNDISHARLTFHQPWSAQKGNVTTCAFMLSLSEVSSFQYKWTQGSKITSGQITGSAFLLRLIVFFVSRKHEIRFFKLMKRRRVDVYKVLDLPDACTSKASSERPVKVFFARKLRLSSQKVNSSR